MSDDAARAWIQEHADELEDAGIEIKTLSLTLTPQETISPKEQLHCTFHKHTHCVRLDALRLTDYKTMQQVVQEEVPEPPSEALVGELNGVLALLPTQDRLLLHELSKPNVMQRDLAKEIGCSQGAVSARIRSVHHKVTRLRVLSKVDPNEIPESWNAADMLHGGPVGKWWLVANPRALFRLWIRYGGNGLWMAQETRRSQAMYSFAIRALCKYLPTNVLEAWEGGKSFSIRWKGPDRKHHLIGIPKTKVWYGCQYTKRGETHPLCKGKAHGKRGPKPKSN